VAHQSQPQPETSGTRDARRALLAQLDEVVKGIIGAVEESANPETLPVDNWTAKDTLGHIAFWHESFARNAKALVDGRQPKVLSGKYPDLNRQGVEHSRSMSVGQIAGRIKRAQAVIRRCLIRMPANVMIPYRQGSRDYSPDEHIAIVRDHIVAHWHRIEKAARRERRRSRAAGSAAREAQ